jgi:Tfp pilus assembly protein PilN
VNSNLNLASKPFTNRILPWVLTFGILGVAFVGLLVVVALTTSANGEATRIEAEINTLKQEEKKVLEAAKEVKGSLTLEEQEGLKAAHQLVDRRTFSWSKLFGDLEASLPNNVRVSRIAVRNITSDGEVTVAELELAAFAKSPTTIIDMIGSMNKDGIFQAQLVSQNLQKGRGEAGTIYELLVVYRPRAGFTPQSVAKVEDEASVKDASVKEEPR